MVPQLCQDRNYIISDFIALQESALAIQLANVDRAIPEPDVVAAEVSLHAKRRFAHIEQELPREFPEKPKHPEAEFGHSERHVGIMSAL